MFKGYAPGKVQNYSKSDHHKIIKATYDQNLRFRSSHRRCSIQKGVRKTFAKFTGKHLPRVSFLIKLQTSTSNFIKKVTLPQVFQPVNFAKILRIFFLQNTSGGCFWGLYHFPYLVNQNEMSQISETFENQWSLKNLNNFLNHVKY